MKRRLFDFCFFFFFFKRDLCFVLFISFSGLRTKFNSSFVKNIDWGKKKKEIKVIDEEKPPWKLKQEEQKQKWNTTKEEVKEDSRVKTEEHQRHSFIFYSSVISSFYFLISLFFTFFFSLHVIPSLSSVILQKFLLSYIIYNIVHVIFCIIKVERLGHFPGLMHFSTFHLWQHLGKQPPLYI